MYNDFKLLQKCLIGLLLVVLRMLIASIYMISVQMIVLLCIGSIRLILINDLSMY